MFRVTRLLVYFLLTAVVTFLTVFATSSLSADESDQEMTPTLYIIDSEWIVKFANVGRTTREKLVEALNSIL